MTAKYIIFSGGDGVGKTTQVDRLAKHLKNQGHKVLVTKEPGSSHSPLTMKLRNLMLDAQYEPEMTILARELISQAIRSIHLEKIVIPALENYDYVVQDRGMIDGTAYAMACGIREDDVTELLHFIFDYANIGSIPNMKMILLSGDPEALLLRARNSKQEFETGDAIEAKGVEFAKQVDQNFKYLASEILSPNFVTIEVDNKTPEQVFEEVLKSL